jgi:glycosyltransferase involved in cell wall biosynthesis
MITHHWPPLTHHSDYSGYERIAHYMKDLCEVKVLTWGKPKGTVRDDVPTKRVWTPSTDIFLERRLILSFSAALEAGDFDIVHSLYSVPAAFPALKTKVVATVHVVPEISPDNLWLQYKGKWQKFLFKRCSSVIAVSNNLLEVVKREYRPKRITFIPHGIDTDHFRPEQDAIDFFADSRSRFDLVCLTIGVHGADLVETFGLAKEHRNIQFVLVGSESHDGKKPENVVFPGRLSEEDMLNAYNSCDFFFRPLKFATANNSLLEAMAMGKAIITDRIPGVIDYLDDQNAFLVDDKDYESAFKTVINDEGDRRRRASSARKKAVSEFDWKVVAERTKEVYEDVLSAN